RAPVTAPKLVIRVGASALFASARYRPEFYPGRLTLFTPREREPGLPPLETIWTRHAESVSVIETPGTHLTMLAAPNADGTAPLLTQSLLNGGTARRYTFRAPTHATTNVEHPNPAH